MKIIKKVLTSIKEVKKALSLSNSSFFEFVVISLTLQEIRKDERKREREKKRRKS